MCVGRGGCDEIRHSFAQPLPVCFVTNASNAGSDDVVVVVVMMVVAFSD